jgi:inorganic pyrophosphatase
MVFPLDFAFVPSTLAGDGDPVDLLILPEASLPVGSIVNVQILGILEAEQYRGNKKPRRNDRVIARLIESRLFFKIRNIDQLGKTFVEELSTFFSTYKRLRGQTYNVIGVGGPDRAADVILECAEEYQRNGGESAS